jgi:hypothetical protein
MVKLDWVDTSGKRDLGKEGEEHRNRITLYHTADSTQQTAHSTQRTIPASITLTTVPVVKFVQFLEWAGQGPGCAYHTGGRLVAVGEVLQHLLARQTPRGRGERGEGEDGRRKSKKERGRERGEKRWEDTGKVCGRRCMKGHGCVEM